MNNSIKLFSNEFLKKIKKAYLQHSIEFYPSPKKIESVYLSYGLPFNETIIAIIDCTVFGSGKNGGAITETGFYWKNDWTQDSLKTYLTWDEMSSMDIIASNNIFSMKITFEKNVVFGMSGSFLKPNTLLFLFKSIIMEYNYLKSNVIQFKQEEIEQIQSLEQVKYIETEINNEILVSDSQQQYKINLTRPNRKPRQLRSSSLNNNTISSNITTEEVCIENKNVLDITLDSNTNYNNEPKSKIGSIFTQALNKGKELKESIETKIADFDFKDFFGENFNNKKFFGFLITNLNKLTDKANTTFELNKDMIGVVNSIKDKQLTSVSSSKEIFEQCKNETLQKTITEFYLSPILSHVTKQQGNEIEINCDESLQLEIVSSETSLTEQQVVGLIIYEIVNVFIDEIKDIACNDKLSDAKTFKNNIPSVVTQLKEKLNLRFKELQLAEKAKKLGLEFNILEILNIAPQILISIIAKLPTFIISIMKESVFSLIGCIRGFIRKDTNKYDLIKKTMASTASTEVSIYLTRVIPPALNKVSFLKKFSRPATDVLVSLFVTAIPLIAIYYFDKHKATFSFFSKKKTEIKIEEIDVKVEK